MANTISYSKLKGAGAGFNGMLKGFGVVTVMNAKVFDYAEVCKKVDAEHPNDAKLESFKADEILGVLREHEQDQTGLAIKPLCTLKTLKVTNVSQEGPTKTITGGQYNNALFKFGKTATMEIQDALGNIDAIEALCGGVVESFTEQRNAVGHDDKDTDVLHIGSDFGSAKTILGETFFIDKESGEQVKVDIIFYQFLPDSIFNLTQDAEGDATVFDMNGSLGVTDITVGTDGFAAGDVVHGVFYSIISPNNKKGSQSVYYTAEKATATGIITITPAAGCKVSLDNATASADPVTIGVGVAAHVQVFDSEDVKVLDTTVANY